MIFYFSTDNIYSLMFECKIRLVEDCYIIICCVLIICAVEYALRHIYVLPLVFVVF